MEKWLNSSNVSEQLKEQLNNYSAEEKEFAFSGNIEFGTAGMRGKMGPGDNNINENVINWATIGYIKYLKANFENPSVVIAYDNRNNSKYYADICAKALTNNNIKTFIFDKITATPILSFTIRKLNASGGINITASHNPKSDNGYKLYDNEGCQYLPDEINNIKGYINEIAHQLDVAIYNDINNDYYQLIDNVDDYIKFVDSITTNNFKQYEKIAITPLHGCGSILKEMNDVIKFENISYIDEQMVEDGNFTTCTSPNPESSEAYMFARSKLTDQNYILATDPDADRVGLYDVRKKVLYTGNQIAVIILNYLIETNQYNYKSEILYSTVSSKLPYRLAIDNNIATKEVLTGFKYIGKLMDEKTFLMGFEESNGYLLHTNARDKDGISAAFKLIEIINYYYNQNLTIHDILHRIYNKYGVYYETQTSVFITDAKKIEQLMNELDFNFIDNIKYVEDFRTSEIITRNGKKPLDFEKTNMVKVVLKNESWFAIRPSGTEPKVKIYYSLVVKNEKEGKIIKANLDRMLTNILEG